MSQVNLWLDDIRPAPVGWVHVKTVEEAMFYFETGLVGESSLDHDLGACEKCNGRTPEQWMEEHDYKSMPNCEHVGTGYTLICWIEETGCWPVIPPRVHSANLVGRAKMLAAIERYYRRQK